MKVFIVIPAYNEEKHIGQIVADCRAHHFEHVLVVDDGSTDGTAKEAEKAGAVVLRHFVNRGVGAATQTGLTAANLLDTEYVITLDADGQHEVKNARDILSALEKKNADIVVGSRFIRDNKIPFLRRIFNALANLVTFLLSGTYLSDSQSGMRGFNRKALSQIVISANGYEFSSEIVREARYYHLRITEVPITVHYTTYSLSKGQNFATGIATVVKLIIRSLMR